MPFKKYLTGLACATALLIPAAHAGDESNQAKIARAMTAAPSSISANATIMDMDGTILREGSNGWTCSPGVIVMAGDKHPMCNDAVWTRFFKAAAAGEPFSTDELGTSYMLMGDAMVNNDDPADAEQNEGENWVEEGPHLMLLMPSADMMKSISHDPKNGGPYVMWGKTPLAHIMVPLGKMHK